MVVPELISNLLLLSLTYAWDNKIWRKFDRGLRQMTYEISSQYRNAFHARHGNVKILGMKNKIPVEDLYIPLAIADHFDERFAMSLDSDQEVYSKCQIAKGNALEQNLQTNFRYVNEHPFLIIDGSVGSGKSTFLKRIGLEALKQEQECRYSHKKIPVYIDVNAYQLEPKSLRDLICTEFEIADLPDSHKITDSTLDSGDLLILIDGLDDLDENHQLQRLGELKDFIDRYPRNRYIIARKQATGSGYLNRFERVSLRSLELFQIEEYIRKWFSPNNQEVGMALLREIKEHADFPLDVCRNPLLLTMTCLLYNNPHSLPVKHSVIHELALKTLLEDWLREKGEDTSQNFAHLKEEVLANLACIIFQGQRDIIFRKDLLSILEAKILENEDLNGTLKPSQLLYELEYKHGILASQRDGTYRFGFASLKEYLVAYHFAFVNQYLEGLISGFLLEQRWEHIFVLLSSIRQSDELIPSMLDHINHFYASDRLRHLALWAARATRSSEAAIRNPAKISYALFILIEVVYLYRHPCAFRNSLFSCNNKLRSLIAALDVNAQPNYLIDPKLLQTVDAKTLIEISNSLIQRVLKAGVFGDTEKLKIFAHKLNKLSDRMAAKRAGTPTKRSCLTYLYSMWMRVLDIDEALVSFNLEDIRCLRNYLYSYELILKCRGAARHISPRIWLKVEYQFLLYTKA